jgi:hypothetical protein
MRAVSQPRTDRQLSPGELFMILRDHAKTSAVFYRIAVCVVDAPENPVAGIRHPWLEFRNNFFQHLLSKNLVLIFLIYLLFYFLLSIFPNLPCKKPIDIFYSIFKVFY